MSISSLFLVFTSIVHFYMLTLYPATLLINSFLFLSLFCGFIFDINNQVICKYRFIAFPIHMILISFFLSYYSD